MESNMDDSLTFNDSIREFDPNESIVVGQPEIILDSSTDQNMPMEFDQIVDQPILMETGQEEVVGPELVEQHFTLGPDGQYTLHDNQPMETVIETTPFITSTSRVGVQFTPQTYIQTSANTVKAVQGTPHFVAIRPTPPQAPQTQPSPSPLRHIAIAPKPSQMHTGKNIVSIKRPVQPQFTTTKLVKKVSLSNVMQAAKGQPVLAQIGKQLVMIPAGGGAQQKIKLMKADGKPIQTQFIQTKRTPNMAKVVVENQPHISQIDNINQSAVLTKLNVGNASFSIANTANPQAPRFVTVQSKTVPVSLGNSVIMASPTQQIVTKQQVLLGSPQKKPGKKFIITMNPQESPAKPVTPQKPTITKAPDNLHTQIHKINVPGKGIQYIKLVTNKNAQIQPTNVVTKPKPATGKTIVLTDNKGNFIQMIDGKVGNQPMVVTSGAANKVVKPVGSVSQPAKLVRIAPVGSNNPQQQITIAPAQPRTQSLLAPSEPPPLAELTRTTIPEIIPEPQSILPDNMEPENKIIVKTLAEEEPQDYVEEELTDADLQTQEVEISFERQSSIAQDESTHSAEEFSMADLQDDEHPLLVMKPNTGEKKKKKRMKKEEYLLERGLSISQNTLMGAVSPPHENDLPELELRPRKPCNCTKSQCLKLYCDCFANGEFCNNCNCHNCHNNLENEELRQKAIRGCLDRNPNAFRPKIGKSRVGSAGAAGALPAPVRRHNKGCNCKRSGCLKNYCECYEAKIACSSICKCFGCRNVEDNLGRRIDAALQAPASNREPPALLKQPCSFMTAEVIEAVCQCLVAAAAEPPSPPATPAAPAGGPAPARDPVAGVIEEFARCLQDIVSAAQQGPPVSADESRT